MDSIVLGGGCFWCIEAVYQRVKGVTRITSGYAGGDIDQPTYERHGTHAEVVRVEYDPNVISLSAILEIFFGVHDPTTLNRQGNDVGEQYRSIILCAADEISNVQHAKQQAQKQWDEPIVTEIKLLDAFYPAEDYHQDYYNQNQSAGYCQVIINPKLEKFRKNFSKYIINQH